MVGGLNNVPIEKDCPCISSIYRKKKWGGEGTEGLICYLKGFKAWVKGVFLEHTIEWQYLMLGGLEQRNFL